MECQETIHVEKMPKKGPWIFVADVGGTKTTFGLIREGKKGLELILSLYCYSNTITSFTKAVQEVLVHLEEHYKIVPTRACCGVAGVVSPERDFSTPTNLSFTVDAKKLMQSTLLQSVAIINDFEANAYGIQAAPEKCIATIKPPEQALDIHATKAILGAGTGLGKSTIIWSKLLKNYVPHPSEGGHGDASLQHEQEFKLAKFIRARHKKKDRPISWEDILSGRGLQTIYMFLGKSGDYKQTATAKEIAAHNYDPSLIAKHRKKDPQSKDTFELFTTLYARCAKNFALDTLARGGIYLAGGIAAKNLELWRSKAFLDEFHRCEKMGAILREIPLYVITEPLLALYGCGAYVLLQEKQSH